ncbi:MAG: hypothetical protein ACP5KV_06230 [Candidatus Methanomethylicaceae archaeon]
MLSETCRFKLSPNEGQKAILEELFSTYESIVGECLNKAIAMNITSRKRLHEAVYREQRTKYPTNLSFAPHLYSYNSSFRDFQVI